MVALDQGTTSSRALLYDVERHQIVGMAQFEFTQYFPNDGWVEHDPMEIWETQLTAFEEVLRRTNVGPEELVGVGITNQRETTVVWDKQTGRPAYRAIVWQDKRTAPICEQLIEQGLTDHIREVTGLVPDSYFSGTKLKWILDHVPQARAKAEAGQLLFGTVDTWLMWKLTKGSTHATDYSNASRTMLFDIDSLTWDQTMLEALHIPASVLPEVQPSAHHFGDFEYKGHHIPILSVAGDQQAALFGQACFAPGMAKNTYGTGCFMLMNTGEKRVKSTHGLLTTLAWGIIGQVNYALEGSVFIAGAAVQWLRDGLKLIDTAPDSEYFAKKVGMEHGVYVVPAFTGLGAPYWDMYARGAIFGLTRDTGKDHIVRATLESLAFQSKDVLDAMEKDAGTKLKSLKVDGGAAANDLLMQFQSDVLQTLVERPVIIESTAMGVILMAGITAGIWHMEDLYKLRKIDRVFQPGMEPDKAARLYKGWHKAVKRTLGWNQPDED